MTIKDKNISFQAANLLDKLLSKESRCFRLTEVYLLLPESNKLSVRKLLSEMTKRGLLMRLKAGLYYIVPFEDDAVTFMPEWHSIAGCVADGDYYIGYYSALQIHQLVTQPSLKEQIVVPIQHHPARIKVKNVSFQFIYHNATHYFGYTKKWVDSYHKVNCSDLEKTFIDCLFKPEYAGGIVEIAKALYICRNEINYLQLMEYVEKFKSQAVLKRLGFLLEFLEINCTIVERLKTQKTKGYVLLDTVLPKQGKYISRWNIRQNLDSDTIKSAVYT